MNLSIRQKKYLKLMNIDIWRSRESGDDEILSEKTDEDQLPSPLDDKSEQWNNLKNQVSGCNKCVLHQSRNQTVFGSGSETADWMLIGEAPGAEEDRLGEPFVGKAGMLLTSMLNAIGLKREQVFIANILKCRPPNDRDPAANEVVRCGDYLRKQILYIKPKIILAVGSIAAQNLLDTDVPFDKLRGKVYEYSDLEIPMLVTYHPAYLLMSPREKRKSWDDLQAALKLYNELSQ
ncbi:MAG: uracil-DNA glycosylase family 4 [Gammaproteobacteria bacterium]|jgi:uracil-DNA glycosylase family 4